MLPQWLSLSRDAELGILNEAGIFIYLELDDDILKSLNVTFKGYKWLLQSLDRFFKEGSLVLNQLNPEVNLCLNLMKFGLLRPP